MGWTDERVATLKKLWLDGLSCSQIAKQLGGVTRNAVIGKVHRLGLSGRAAPSQPARPAFKAPRPARPVATKPVRATTLKPSAATVPAPARRTDELGSATSMTLRARMCKWPIGDPLTDEFTFCGRRTGGPVSYCREHAQVAYQPTTEKKRASGALDLARSLRRYI